MSNILNDWFQFFSNNYIYNKFFRSRQDEHTTHLGFNPYLSFSLTQRSLKSASIFRHGTSGFNLQIVKKLFILTDGRRRRIILCSEFTSLKLDSQHPTFCNPCQFLMSLTFSTLVKFIHWMSVYFHVIETDK